jgi:hypothetical protein
MRAQFQGFGAVAFVVDPRVSCYEKAMLFPDFQSKVHAAVGSWV